MNVLDERTSVCADDKRALLNVTRNEPTNQPQRQCDTAQKYVQIHFRIKMRYNRIVFIYSILFVFIPAIIIPYDTVWGVYVGYSIHFPLFFTAQSCLCLSNRWIFIEKIPFTGIAWMRDRRITTTLCLTKNNLKEKQMPVERCAAFHFCNWNAFYVAFQRTDPYRHFLHFIYCTFCAMTIFQPAAIFTRMNHDHTPVRFYCSNVSCVWIIEW